MKEDYTIRERTIPATIPASGLSPEELITAVQIISKERLTTKQKIILREINHLQQEMTVTTFVVHSAELLHCSKTAVWNNVRQLNAIGLIRYGGANTKGIPLTITSLGKIICKGLEE